MRTLLPSFLKNAILILIGVVLFGVAEKGKFWIAVGMWMVLRVDRLWQESRRRQFGDPDWEALEEHELSRINENFASLRAEDVAGAQGALLAEQDRQRSRCRAAIAGMRAAYVRPRPAGVLWAEGFGNVGYLVVLPVVLALALMEFVSFRRSYGWQEMAVFAGCAGLYALPLLKRWQGLPPRYFWLWWAAPMVVLIPFGWLLVKNVHPYLDPLNPDRLSLAAEKVLSLEDHIAAADHADWIVRYAESLPADQQKEALRLCEAALRMQPHLPGGSRLLDRLRGEEADSAALDELALPYTGADTPIPVMPRCVMEDAVDNEPVCTVIVMPAGEVPDELLDYIAFVMRQETGLPVKVYAKALPLPEHSRRMGLAVGRQWSAESIFEVFAQETNGRSVRGPLKFLVVTGADIYYGSANYVFAANYPWGAIVSTARLQEGAGAALLRLRAAKQCYGSLIKSFDVLPSADRRCVTSYTRGIADFDAKGNRPLPSVRRQFLDAVAKVNEQWPKRLR